MELATKAAKYIPNIDYVCKSCFMKYVLLKIQNPKQEKVRIMRPLK